MRAVVRLLAWSGVALGAAVVAPPVPALDPTTRPLGEALVLGCLAGAAVFVTLARRRISPSGLRNVPPRNCSREASCSASSRPRRRRSGEGSGSASCSRASGGWVPSPSARPCSPGRTWRGRAGVRWRTWQRARVRRRVPRHRPPRVGDRRPRHLQRPRRGRRALARGHVRFGHWSSRAAVPSIGTTNSAASERALTRPTAVSHVRSTPRRRREVVRCRQSARRRRPRAAGGRDARSARPERRREVDRGLDHARPTAPGRRASAPGRPGPEEARGARARRRGPAGDRLPPDAPRRRDRRSRPGALPGRATDGGESLARLDLESHRQAAGARAVRRSAPAARRRARARRQARARSSSTSPRPAWMRTPGARCCGPRRLRRGRRRRAADDPAARRGRGDRNAGRPARRRPRRRSTARWRRCELAAGSRRVTFRAVRASAARRRLSVALAARPPRCLCRGCGRLRRGSRSAPMSRSATSRSLRQASRMRS